MGTGGNGLGAGRRRSCHVLLTVALIGALALLSATPTLAASWAAPTIAISGNDGAWHAPPVTLTFTATCDPGLTVTAMEYSTDGGATWTEIPGPGATRTLPISTQGFTTVTARATDSAAQVSATQQTTVSIDAAQPQAKANCRPLPNKYGYNKGKVRVILRKKILGPSGAFLYYRVGRRGAFLKYKTTLPVEADGLTRVYYYALSGAGVKSKTKIFNVRIDSTIPLSDVLSESVTARTDSYVTLRYRIEDDFCHRAKVQLTIYANVGRKEAQMNLGLVPTNKNLRCRIKVAARPGTYSFTFYCTNLAGTSDPMPARGILIVQ